jgi:hypothetical protein
MHSADAVGVHHAADSARADGASGEPDGIGDVSAADAHPRPYDGCTNVHYNEGADIEPGAYRGG